MGSIRTAIIDIDGVLVDSSSRYERDADLATLSSGDYNGWVSSMHRYNSHTEGDVILRCGVDLVDHVCDLWGVDRRIVLTARGEIGRGPTLSFFEDAYARNLMPWEVHTRDLIMGAKADDFGGGVSWCEGDAKFCPVTRKREVVQRLRDSDHDLIVAFDDKVSTCEMYWGMGVHSICVMAAGVNCENNRVSK